MQHRLTWLLLLVAATLGAQQNLDPVTWSLRMETPVAAPGDRAVAKLTARVQEGWHLYASTSPQGKPIAMQLGVTAADGIASWQASQPQPDKQFDAFFNQESHWYEGEAEFWIELELSDAAQGAIPIEATIRYGACDATRCLPPKTRSAKATLTIGERAAAIAIPADFEPVYLFDTPAPKDSGRDVLIEAAATAGTAETGETVNPSDQGLIRFAAVAFGFGLLSIFTPCVFPMIPVMMSYFVSTQSGEKKASITQAVTFVAGVIALFTGMGAAVSVALGPFGMQLLAGNVWVNLLIAVVFFAFGASLLGAFEMSIPSGLMTALNQKAGSGGLLPTLMMGLVFALASFACTGPFVGALLAGSVSGGSLAWPIFGMLFFSAGLALPFFGLALFPSYLDRMPKAGGWMSRVKITMAFVIVAAGFKYLSNVDQAFQLEFLTRERFLAIWAVLFSLAGLYLLGLIKLDYDDNGEPLSLARLGSGALFLVFAASLLPGMFGGPLGNLDAYVPEARAGAYIGGGSASAKQEWLKDDYEGALAKAANSGKPALLIFTGYYCTNCKWMKTNMFPRPEIAAAVAETVPVQLYTDDADPAISDRHQALLADKFDTVAIPFYALVDGDGNTIETFAGSTSDEASFLAFLESRPAKQVSELD